MEGLIAYWGFILGFILAFYGWSSGFLDSLAFSGFVVGLFLLFICVLWRYK